MGEPTSRSGGLFDDWVRWWTEPWRALRWAPQNLVQPILPGWSFGGVTINENNSSSPRTEAAILETQSYGRQLGRLGDALDAVIGHLDGVDGDDPRIRDFLTMQREIAAVKERTAGDDVEQARALLERIRTVDPKAYAALLRDLPDGPDDG